MDKEQNNNLKKASMALAFIILFMTLGGFLLGYALGQSTEREIQQSDTIQVERVTTAKNI